MNKRSCFIGSMVYLPYAQESNNNKNISGINLQDSAVIAKDRDEFYVRSDNNINACITIADTVWSQAMITQECANFLVHQIKITNC